MPDPEPYSYDTTARADRDLARLPRRVAEACAVHIHERLRFNPQRMTGREMGPPFAGCVNAHINGYRIVIRIDEERRHFDIVTIGPRGTVYNG